MEKMRCSWGNSKNPLYQEYHDNEWGKLNLDLTYPTLHRGIFYSADSYYFPNYNEFFPFLTPHFYQL